MPPVSLVIDPGHGGPLSYGAIWPPFLNGKKLAGAELEAALAAHAATAVAVEKRINLALASELQSAVAGCGWPVDVAVTRTGDQELSLLERAAFAAKYRADIVLVLHCDTAAQPGVSGLWTYVRPDDSVALAVARDIACAVPRPLRRAGGSVEPRVVQNRPHWTGAAYHVLAHYAAPAVLVECGFVSHEGDRALLTSDIGRSRIVATLLGAIAGLRHRREAVRSL